MFDKPDECCDMLNGQGGGGEAQPANHRDCVIKKAPECIDIGGQYKPCTDPWHPTTYFEGCSNSPLGTYPSDWTAPGSPYLYKTHKECCEAIFVYKSISECPKTNYCPTLEPTPSPVSCPSGNKWHRSTDSYTYICTNDLDYPSAWNDPFLVWDYLFDTSAQCCARSVNKEGTCTVVDICGPGETVESLVMPIANSPTEVAKLTSTEGQMAPQSPMGCERIKKKKPCFRKQCIWDDSIDSCTDVVLTVMFAETEPGKVLGPPTVPAKTELQQTALNEGPTTSKPTCGGRKKKKTCVKAECVWNVSTNSCSDVPTTNSPKSTSMRGEVTTQPNIVCGGIRKKELCTNAECIWDVSIYSCADAVLALPGERNQVVSVGGNHDCDKRKYHPKSVLIRECSNDDSFPSVWASSPDMRNTYFFAVGDDCCDIIYSDGPCIVVNICSPTSL